VLTVEHIPEIKKLLKEDGYEVTINRRTTRPAIYKRFCNKQGIYFFWSDLFNRTTTVAEAVIYLKNLYDNT